MWKKLLAVGVVLAGVGTPARAFVWDKQPVVPMPSGVLQTYQSSASDPWGIGHSSGDFVGPIFATPLPPGPGRVTVPCGGPLMAPVITPLAATNPGHLADKFEVIPAGWGEKPIVTKHPDRYVGPDACDPCTPCDPRAWADFEFLYWATQGVVPPPLVTTGPPTAAPGVAGALGQPTTIPIFGGERTLNQFRPGFRTEVGYWFEPDVRWGVSARFYFLGAVSERLLAAGNGFNVVNVPQLIASPAGPVAVPLYVGYPGLTTGTVSASTHSDFLGGDVSLRRGFAGGPVRFDLLGGYRVMHLGDNLLSAFDVVPAGALSPRLVGEDRITSRNQFHGAQVGFLTSCRYGCFSLELQSTVALGVTVSDFDDTRVRAFGGSGGVPGGLVGFGPVPVPGGGTVQTVTARGGQVDYFAVVPEVGTKLGWNPSDHVRLTFGYNFLYWSRVRRAQELFEPGSNNSTDFWAQGINWGLELRY
jgi:hypothetical protein